jgi:homoserine kinase
MAWAQHVVRVRVPATSANLGPGFDALGLALTLYDDVDAWICPSGLSIEISGEGADLAEAGEEHLVLRAMRAAFAVTGGQPPGIGLRCVNRIPHGRGLGSSAAAIVAGILAARALSSARHPAEAHAARLGAGVVHPVGAHPAGAHPAGVHPAGVHAGGLGAAGNGAGGLGAAGDGAGGLGAARLGPSADGAGESGAGELPDDALLGLATGLEGHPDNVAACLAGGLTVAWTAAGHPRMVHLDPLPSLLPVVCIAPAPIRTDVARRLLPDLVSHSDAAANAGRSALLVAALTQLSPVGAGALFDATQDWLHQDYRAAAMPDTAELVRRLRGAGIPAVVSGAGPSVLALLARPEKTDYRHHLDRLGSIVRETGIAWHISSLDVERHGARVLRPEPSPGC